MFLRRVQIFRDRGSGGGQTGKGDYNRKAMGEDVVDTFWKRMGKNFIKERGIDESRCRQEQ